MVKLLSLFVFVAAFVWTWFMFTGPSSIGIDIHAGIQSKLSVLIEDSIKKSKPNSSDFEVLRISTQKIDDNKMSAKFSYRFIDSIEENEKTLQTFNGEAILTRGLSENPQVQKWIVQSVKSNADNIEFREGLVISSDGKSEPVPLEEQKQ